MKHDRRLILNFSLLGVVALWGDCTFIPADRGSYIVPRINEGRIDGDSYYTM